MTLASSKLIIQFNHHSTFKIHMTQVLGNCFKIQLWLKLCLVGVIIEGMENRGEKMVYLVVWLSGKRGEILVGSRAQKSNFPFDEKIKEILVSFASVFTIIFLSSLTMFNTSTATSVLWFVLFSSVLLIVFCWIFFFFLIF